MVQLNTLVLKYSVCFARHFLANRTASDTAETDGPVLQCAGFELVFCEHLIPGGEMKR